MTDTEFSARLYDTLKTVLPDVWEGVYTGNDVDKYITFVYYTRGEMYANDNPTAKTYNVTVTLWAKNRVNVSLERSDIRTAIWRDFEAYPTTEIGYDDGWKQYIYEFSVSSEIEGRDGKA